MPSIGFDINRGESVPLEQCGVLLDQLEELPGTARRSYLGQRLREALEYVERRATADALR